MPAESRICLPWMITFMTGTVRTVPIAASCRIDPPRGPCYGTASFANPPLAFEAEPGHRKRLAPQRQRALDPRPRDARTRATPRAAGARDARNHRLYRAA